MEKRCGVREGKGGSVQLLERWCVHVGGVGQSPERGWERCEYFKSNVLR